MREWNMPAEQPSARPHRFWRSPALPFVESRRASDSRACYAPHSHASLSLGAVDGGHSVFRREGICRHLYRGDVVLIPPGEVHSCNPEDDGEWSYQMLYLDPAWVNDVVRESSGREFVQFFLPAAMRQDRVHARLTWINRYLFSDASDQEKESELLCFVGSLFLANDGAERPCENEKGVPRHLRDVRRLIEERCADELPLAMLAEIAGMSRYHFVRAFRREVGMTPHAWQIDARIRQARRLLNDNVSLADVALQLGFADQSHFQRAFKQRVAATPGEYRRNLLQD